jgi:hypothetical protein
MLIKKLAKARPGKQLVMANLIPLWMTFRPDQLAQLDVGKRNRWLKDAFAAAGFRRVMPVELVVALLPAHVRAAKQHRHVDVV